MITASVIYRILKHLHILWHRVSDPAFETTKMGRDTIVIRYPSDKWQTQAHGFTQPYSLKQRRGIVELSIEEWVSANTALLLLIMYECRRIDKDWNVENNPSECATFDGSARIWGRCWKWRMRSIWWARMITMRGRQSTRVLGSCRGEEWGSNKVAWAGCIFTWSRCHALHFITTAMGLEAVIASGHHSNSRLSNRQHGRILPLKQLLQVTVAPKPAFKSAAQRYMLNYIHSRCFAFSKNSLSSWWGDQRRRWWQELEAGNCLSCQGHTISLCHWSTTTRKRHRRVRVATSLAYLEEVI